MGCHTWCYKNEYDREHQRKQCDHDFMFRIFDYDETVLRSFDQAKAFVLDYLAKSTNNQPTLPSETIVNNDIVVITTYTGQMRGKIKLASDINETELKDPTLTIQRLREFFDRYPVGVIEFG